MDPTLNRYCRRAHKKGMAPVGGLMNTCLGYGDRGDISKAMDITSGRRAAKAAAKAEKAAEKAVKAAKAAKKSAAKAVSSKRVSLRRGVSAPIESWGESAFKRLTKMRPLSTKTNKKGGRRRRRCYRAKRQKTRKKRYIF